MPKNQRRDISDCYQARQKYKRIREKSSEREKKNQLNITYNTRRRSHMENTLFLPRKHRGIKEIQFFFYFGPRDGHNSDTYNKCGDIGVQ